MKIAVFDTHRHDRVSLDEINTRFGHELVYLEARLTAQTAKLAAGFDVACSFVNDRVDRAALQELHAGGSVSSPCAPPASTTSTSMPPPSSASPSCASPSTRRTRSPSTPSRSCSRSIA